MAVSGGLGESETGGPVMNIVPRSGGNKFSGQAFYNTAGEVVERRQPRRRTAGHRHHEAGRRHQCVRRQRLARRPDQARSSCGSSAAYRKLSTAQARAKGSSANQYAFDAGALGLPARRQPVGARRPGPRRCIRGAVHRRRSTPKNRVTFSQQNQLPLRGLDADAQRDGCRHARQRLDRDGVDHAVARGEHRLLRLPVLADAGDLDVDR